MARSLTSLSSLYLAWSYLIDPIKRTLSSSNVMEKTSLILLRREVKRLNKFVPYTPDCLNALVIAYFGADLGDDDIEAFAL